MLITDMKKYGKVGGGLKFALTTGPLWFLTFKGNEDNSHGATQIKHVEDYVPERFNIDNTDLDKPENVAIATMFVLANKYKTLKKCEKNHAGITDENRMEYLCFFYMGSSAQVCNGNATVKYNSKADKVRRYGSSLTILETP